MTLALLVLVVGAVVSLTGFLVYGGRSLVAFTGAGDETHVPGAQVLRYHLVTGQDSSELLDAVQTAGYHASTEYDMGQVDLVVLCAGDVEAEREGVRAAITAAPMLGGGARDFSIPPVQFADETG